MAPLRLGSDKRGLGLIPSPIDLFSATSTHMGLKASAYPVSYDLRTLGKLTPIEDQGQYDTCWAFATMGSLESCLLPSDPESFSEDNLILDSGFDSSLDHSTATSDSASAYMYGGSADMATAYLARWGGPVAATAEAYGAGSMPAGLAADKHVQEVLYLPSRTGPLDDDAIKSAIMTYGAVWTSMYADDGMCAATDSAAYNAAEAAYYFDGAADQQNHAVDIVGWNDDYPAANFSQDGVTAQPPGNGAFVVRNSWGTAWGDAGYFYVSYYDTNFAYGENDVFDDAEPTSNYSGIYQYDPLGWTDSYGYASDTAWFANKFTATASNQLAAVSFYTAAPGSGYTIYTGGSLSSLTPDGSGSLSVAGYHTVVVSSPVQLTSGQPFVVAVDLTTPGNDYPIPLETRIAGYTSDATSAAGESFVSANGGTWTDLTAIGGERESNVCLKAFTIGSAAPTPTPACTPTLTLKLSGLTSGALKLGKRVKASGTVMPLGLVGCKVTLTVQRDRGGKWPRVLALVRTVGTGGTYGWSYKPPTKGIFRVKATIGKTSTHAAAKTTWRVSRVD
jgi:C1A family cysteine protease